eukprot:scaffold14674_cov141-Skeletonema_menzelii.AAC.7
MESPADKDRDQLHSSLRANSSDFIGVVIDEGGEEADDLVQHHVDEELTSEEKKEAEIGSSVIDSSANDPKSHEEFANNETSAPPLPAAVVGGSSITFKFSYKPRDYEQGYYDQLFYHVASTSNTPVTADKPKEEIIVSPKEAAKLFYKSGVPSERLRMIWNMATLPSTPLPPGTKPPPSMTYGQFRVAVRLIQLFQNRVAAVDEQLTVSEENSGEGVGGSGEGSTRLAPAYFNGISGEIIPLPNNNVVQAIKTMYGFSPSESNEVPASKPNEVTRLARRRTSNSLSTLSTNEGRMNGNIPASEEANLNAAEPMSLAEMEREIRRLTAIVGNLQREVNILKRGNADVPRIDVAEDEDPTVGVEIYWGERKEKEQSPEKRTVTPNETPLKAKVPRSSKDLRSSTPTVPQLPTMDNRRNAASKNRLSQSQNIPAMHPYIPTRTNVARVSVQPTKIPPEGESLTSQMHAVQKQEEFDTLLSHAKERTGGDSGSKTGSRQSNRSGSFRPASVVRRSARDNRPTDLSASARHIVRDKTGKVELYTNFEVEPPSTKAVDLAPLNPPPLGTSFDEQVPVATHRRSLMRRR